MKRLCLFTVFIFLLLSATLLYAFEQPQYNGTGVSAITTGTVTTTGNVTVGGALGVTGATTVTTLSASTSISSSPEYTLTTTNSSFRRLTATTVDINGGAIDGTAIGESSPETGAFTTITATTSVAGSPGFTLTTVGAQATDLTVTNKVYAGSDVEAGVNIIAGGNISAATYETNVSSTELGYLDGVTSAIQTQISNASVYSGSTAVSNGGTLTPTGYDVEQIDITCGSDNASFTLTETSISNGDVLKITNIGANTCLMYHSENIQYIPSGLLTLEQYDSAVFEYHTGDRWVHIGGEQQNKAFASIQLPYSDDPDVDATGEISFDTDEWLRIYSNSIQKGIPTNFYQTFAIADPENLPTHATRSTQSKTLWLNDTGMSIIITEVTGLSDTDDYSFTLFQSNSKTDIGTANDSSLLTAAFTCSADGTSAYYTTVTAGFDDATWETGKWLIFEHGGSAAEDFSIYIKGYYDANVD